MKFSVLIAHYNNAVYFRDCYTSILNQKYDNWEVVILDDCSENSQKEAVKKMIEGDTRFRFYENGENCGVGVTKSKLIELAQGDVCCFVDPDDAIKPSALKSAYNVFSKNKEIVLTYSRFLTCDENLKPLFVFKSAMQVPNGDRCFFNYPVQIAHLVCFRKKVYDKTDKINSDLKISEDQDLYLKMYEKGKVKFIDNSDYLYRTHKKGISQNENKKSSYEYWGKVIFDAMKRRNIETINGKKIPEMYHKSEEIFDLLVYQNSLTFRILKKVKIFFQNL